MKGYIFICTLCGNTVGTKVPCTTLWCCGKIMEPKKEEKIMITNDNVVSNFLDLMKVMKEIKELEIKKRELRASLKIHVEDMGTPISHDGWTAALKTNAIRPNMDYKKLSTEFVEMYFQLIANEVLSFSLPSASTSLVFGKIKEKKK